MGFNFAFLLAFATFNRTFGGSDFSWWYGGDGGDPNPTALDLGRIHFIEWGLDTDYRSIHIRKIIGDNRTHNDLTGWVNDEQCDPLNITDINEYVTFIIIFFGECYGTQCGNFGMSSYIRRLVMTTNKKNNFTCGDTQQAGLTVYQYRSTWNATKQTHPKAKLIGFNAFVGAVIDNVTFQFGWPNTLSPTNVPTNHPTINPTINTFNPSDIPTNVPSNIPSINPTNIPSNNPTFFPTENPSLIPTIYPSNNPTFFPTENPSVIPSTNPSLIPTIYPSNNPSNNPSNIPSINPSNTPSNNPGLFPTLHPSNNPSNNPTNNPTIYPSNVPTLIPSNFPSLSPIRHDPTQSPFKNPTITPTHEAQSNNDTFIQNNLAMIIIISSVCLCIGVIIGVIITLFLRNRKSHKAAKASNDNMIALSNINEINSNSPIITPDGNNSEEFHRIKTLSNDDSTPLDGNNTKKKVNNNHKKSQEIYKNEGVVRPSGSTATDRNTNTTNNTINEGSFHSSESSEELFKNNNINITTKGNNNETPWPTKSNNIKTPTKN